MRIIAILLLLLPLFSLAQNGEFPQQWTGVWKGDLEIYRYNSLIDQIPMSLKIQLLDSNRWTFHISYGERGRERVRPYELVEVDAIKGIYKIDEKNGIVLEANYQGDCLFERFSIAGNMLTSRICKIKDTIFYEITAGTIEASSTTGDTIINNDTIPPVKSYAVPALQKAILTKE